MGKDECSTETAARVARISYVTLRRWVASGAFQEYLRRERRPALGQVVLSGRSLWRWSIENRNDLIHYRDLYYAAGRGHAPSNRQEAKQKQNLRKTLKRRRRYGMFPAAQAALDRSSLGLDAAKRRYNSVLRELKKMGWQPRDSELAKINLLPKDHPFA